MCTCRSSLPVLFRVLIPTPPRVATVLLGGALVSSGARPSRRVRRQCPAVSLFAPANGGLMHFVSSSTVSASPSSRVAASRRISRMRL